MEKIFVPSEETFPKTADVVVNGIHHQGFLFDTDKPDMIPDIEVAVQFHKCLGVVNWNISPGMKHFRGEWNAKKLV